MNSSSDGHREFVPALGRPELTGLYDRAVALLTRERRWRTALLRQIAPAPGDVILDVGCGTGTFAIMLKRRCPDARVIGVDPDSAVLAIARGKADRAGAAIEWHQAMGDELGSVMDEPVTTATSSLVLHQCPVATKRAIVAAMHAVLAPGGMLAIADYGEQRSRLMRALFRQVQRLDGFENTKPNADGVVPVLLGGSGFLDVVEQETVPTLTGSISLYSARKK